MNMTQGCTAILILTYKSSTDTINCIRSIEACNTAPVKYIVVDNGSPDKEAVEQLDVFFSQSGHPYRHLTDSDHPKEELPYFTFLSSSVNDGYARGNNKGLDLAYGDPSVENILILNSDILFTEDILPTLIDFQQKQSACGFVTPLVVTRKGDVDHCCARKAITNWEIIRIFVLFDRDILHSLSRIFRRQRILLNNPEYRNLPSFPVDMPSGACMLIDKHLFQHIGSFDPGTFLYYEENILYKKLHSISRSSHCVPSVRCTHLGAGSTQSIHSQFLQRCNLESADHYLTNYGDMSLLQHLVWNSAKAAWRLKFRIAKFRKAN
ncbi:MAG: glycosyltransferase [Bacteroidales bacterium]|nr:glycosyltransferase [Bacteroidales bacterium]MBR6882026.1 glycosyltransferase [Bacteroidales bacterium]